MKITGFYINNFKGLRSIKVDNCGEINAFIGKNNSGKSSILHGLDIACLALTIHSWDNFQPKLDIKDLINDAGLFELNFTFDDGSNITVNSNPDFGPKFSTQPRDDQRIKSILILPDTGSNMLYRRHRTPLEVIQLVERKNFNDINSLEILYAIKFYSYRNERGLSSKSYEDIVNEISNYFPDIEKVVSDRTEQDIATLTYEEYGKRLDILYSGSGLKHFIDVLIKVTLSNAAIILLDEPELGLHPDLQRKFMDYLLKLVNDKGIQIFMATHSQVLLNYSHFIKFNRIINNKGVREVIPVKEDALQTVISDLGIRPSDIFNHDICLLVEGASEVVFFEYIIRTLYKIEFEKIAIAVIQYGGGAAEGIFNGTIDITNIVPAQKFTFWIHDRDTKPSNQPSKVATKFTNKLLSLGVDAIILKRREIEFYYPEIVHLKAQQGDAIREKATLDILNGEQDDKYKTLAKLSGVCVPSGNYLRKLLQENVLNKTDIDSEIRAIIEDKLLIWKKEILGK